MPRRFLGIMIRDWLLARRVGSPHDFWKEKANDIRYDTVVRYFWLLKQLGLIYEAGATLSSKDGTAIKKLYAITPGRENDPCWLHPQHCVALRRGWVFVMPDGTVVPKTKVGSRRYKEYKEKAVMK